MIINDLIGGSGPRVNPIVTRNLLGAFGEIPNPIIKSNTMVGIEIELENFNPLEPYRFIAWKQEVDGSLRNNGIELQSVPLAWNQIIPALIDVQQTITKVSPGIQFSHRCSVHVHVNVRNLTPEQFVILCCLYSICEWCLFERFAPERKNSSFAIPVNYNEELISFLKKMLGNPRQIIEQPQREIGKYSALGIFRLWDLGTVEFRHLSGTIDPAILVPWINCILSLYNAAETWSLSKLRYWVSVLNTTSAYFLFLKEIFNDPHELFPDSFPIEVISDAVSNVKAVFEADIVVNPKTFAYTDLGKKLQERVV